MRIETGAFGKTSVRSKPVREPVQRAYGGREAGKYDTK